MSLPFLSGAAHHHRAPRISLIRAPRKIEHQSTNPSTLFPTFNMSKKLNVAVIGPTGLTGSHVVVEVHPNPRESLFKKIRKSLLFSCTSLCRAFKIPRSPVSRRRTPSVEVFRVDILVTQSRTYRYRRLTQSKFNRNA